MLSVILGGAAVQRVAQRFSAAMSGVFSIPALAAEVTQTVAKDFFRSL